MGALRVVLVVMLVAAGACFAAYAVTGERRYRGHGLRLLRWAVGIGLAFFAVLIAQRLLER
jgi:hypothetical protein